MYTQSEQRLTAANSVNSPRIAKIFTWQPFNSCTVAYICFDRVQFVDNLRQAGNRLLLTAQLQLSMINSSVVDAESLLTSLGFLALLLLTSSAINVGRALKIEEIRQMKSNGTQR